jgi:hypothetical protein
MAEQLSNAGVPVFLADAKGDLSGSAPPVSPPKKLKAARCAGITDWQPRANPVMFWDVFGAAGHPVRATVSDMGPLLLARLLNLNDTQAGVLQLVFKIADDQGLLLLDLKDLRAMVQHVGDNAAEFKTEYGNVSAASIGAIQRGLLTIEEQGGDSFFGEPMLDIADLMQTDGRPRRDQRPGRRQADERAALYACFLLWLLAELFEQLPEAGDLDKPKLAFFFDEAHLLFNDAPPALLEKIEQVVRLIRSKGVGVYFVTQNPLDMCPTRARPARQPRAARAARLHPARPEGGQGGRRDPARQPGLRRRDGDHRAGRRRGAGVLPRREGPPGRRRARHGAAAALLAHRAAHAERTPRLPSPTLRLPGIGLRKGRGSRIGLREGRPRAADPVHLSDAHAAVRRRAARPCHHPARGNRAGPVLCRHRGRVRAHDLQFSRTIRQRCGSAAASCLPRRSAMRSTFPAAPA